MENQKISLRLTNIQKRLLDIIKKNNIFNETIKLETYETIDTKLLKSYIELHNKIKDILNNLEVEPHEILNLIESYGGNHSEFINLKNLIINRNLCILRTIYDTEQWKKNINKIVDVFKDKFINQSKNNKSISEICNESILEVLLKEINTFDISQCKITLDKKNNLKTINIINLNDQKYIISKLLSKGYNKK